MWADKNYDGTIALHEYYNTGDDDNTTVEDVRWRAQTFTVGTIGENSDFTLYSIKLKLYRVGSPGTLTVSIRETTGYGIPIGADLTSGTYNGDTLTTNTDGEWVEIVMDSTITLNRSTMYAIVVKAPSGSPANEVNWKKKIPFFLQF